VNFSITLHTGAQLDFNPALPDRLKKKEVFPDTLYSIGEWGSIFFQIFGLDGFGAVHSQFIVNEKISIHTRAHMESIRLHIVYKNNFHSNSSLGELRFLERHFNMIYVPEVNIHSHFHTAGEYCCFDITYSREYLQRFTPYVTGLGTFLDKTESSLFSDTNHFSTHGMISVIENVMSHKYKNDFAKFYLESKALELLTLAFEKFDQGTLQKDGVKEPEVEKMKAVKEWIENNDNAPGTLREIARRVGTNEYKLKKDFKAVFGLTVFDYLLKMKLEKAKQMLLDTNLSVSQIAFETGYANQGHFTRAFHKEFKILPSYLRKHR
jgi:AraC family transcriptional regulator, transcriptional activator of the genes for pyochelin and ferripyochelin receptors